MRGIAIGPATAAEVLEVVSLVRGVCARLDPQALSLVDVPATFDALAELERLGGGAVLRMAARYEEAGAWKRNGARSPEDDIARKTGSGSTRARRKLSTSERLRQQPKTNDAVRQGRVSTDQADEVSEGASVAPDAEDALLDTAQRQPLHELRRKVAEERAKADRDREERARRLHHREERARRLHRNRQLRRWDDADGMADLLLGDNTTDAAGSGRQAVRPEKKVIARIDLEALNRGRVDAAADASGAGRRTCSTSTTTSAGRSPTTPAPRTCRGGTAATGTPARRRSADTRPCLRGSAPSSYEN